MPSFDMVVMCAAENQPELAFHGTVVRCPLQDSQLSLSELTYAVGASRAVAFALAGGQRVLVTCHAGLNRSALVVLMARVIPGVSLLVPWYYVFSNLHMVGGYTVLILSHMFVALPLVVYIMMGYFDSLPLELEESAMVDGLTPIGAFRKITLPLSVPGIATAGILAFIFSWNNFMFALVLSGAQTKTLPVAIFNFVGYASIDWGGLMAAATVVTLPIMVIALFTQKYIVSGLTAGATKG